MVAPNQTFDQVAGLQAPFLIPSSAFPSVRYQQIYGASDFTRLGSPVQISDLSFARVPGSPGIDVNLQSIEVRLSTTTSPVDHPSSTFAQNVGADEKVVFSGALHFFENGASTLYNIHLPLTTPFVYNPSAGNLLMEVRNFAPISSGNYSLAGKLEFGDTVALVFAGSATSATGNFSPAGMFTSFTVAAVPEPSSFHFFVGFVSLTCLLRSFRPICQSTFHRPCKD